MKKIFYFILSMIFLTGILKAQDVLVPSYGFEEYEVGAITDNANLPDGAWWLGGFNTFANYAITDQQCHTGKCMQLTVIGQIVEHYGIQVVSQVVHVDRKQAYRLSVWMRAANMNSSWAITVGNHSYAEVCRVGEGGAVGDAFLKPIGQGWQEYRTVFIPDRDSVRIPFHFHTNEVQYWVDDVSLEKSNLAIAEIDETGKILTLHFGYQIHEPSLDLVKATISVKVNGVENPVQSMEYSTVLEGGQLKLTLQNTVGLGAEVTVTNTGPGIEYNEGYFRPTNILDTAGVDSAVADFTEPVLNNSVTAVTYLSNSPISVYPNPLVDNDLLTISGLDARSSSVEILNASGQLVRKEIFLLILKIYL